MSIPIRIGAVLMASGLGVRFGGNKLLQDVDGTPMICRTFAALPAALFDRAIAVSSYPEILALAEERDYRPLPNPWAAEGQTMSIRLGLAELLDMDGVLFAVCDQPWLTHKSAERLLAAFTAFPDKICALSWQGKRGNPVIFPAEFFPRLLALTGDRGGAAVIQANPHRLHLVEAGCAMELRDVDTPDDLSSLSAKFPQIY